MYPIQHKRTDKNLCFLIAILVIINTQDRQTDWNYARKTAGHTLHYDAFFPLKLVTGFYLGLANPINSWAQCFYPSAQRLSDSAVFERGPFLVNGSNPSFLKLHFAHRFVYQCTSLNHRSHPVPQRLKCVPCFSTLYLLWPVPHLSCTVSNTYLVLSRTFSDQYRL